MLAYSAEERKAAGSDLVDPRHHGEDARICDGCGADAGLRQRSGQLEPSEIGRSLCNHHLLQTSSATLYFHRRKLRPQNRCVLFLDVSRAAVFGRGSLETNRQCKFRTSFAPGSCVSWRLP